MLPYCGRLRAGRFQFRGRAYQYALNAPPEPHSSHGEGWLRAWDLVHLDRAKAVMELAAASTSPISYASRQVIEVNEGTLRIELSIRNEDEDVAPFGFGLHPYFTGRSEALVQANLPTQRLWDAEMMPIEDVANPLDRALRQGCPVTLLPTAGEFSSWDGRAHLDWPTRGLHLEVKTAPALKHVVTWLPDGEDFFCFEPQSHATDALNPYPKQPSGQDFHLLAPGEAVRQCFEFHCSVR